MNNRDLTELKRVLGLYSKLGTFADVSVVTPNARGIDEDTPLIVACSQGNLDDVLVMLRHGGDPNLPGDLGNTALHAAASAGRRGIVELLLRSGADASRRNELGQTASEVARLAGHEDIAIALSRDCDSAE